MKNWIGNYKGDLGVKAKKFKPAANKADEEFDTDYPDPFANAPDVKKLFKTWTPRGVIINDYQAQINAKIGVPPGSRGYLRAYQTAVTTLLKDLRKNNKPEWEKIEKAVEIRNRKGPSPETQAK